MERYILWHYGHVDAYGAVHGKTHWSDSSEDGTHTLAQKNSGKAWRWRNSEGFMTFMTNGEYMTDDDYAAVARWLIKRGVEEEHWSFNQLV